MTPADQAGSEEGRPVAEARQRKPPDPAKAWAKRLARTRPGLVPFVHGRAREPVRHARLGARPRPDQRAGAHHPVPEQRRRERGARLRGPAGPISRRDRRRDPRQPRDRRRRASTGPAGAASGSADAAAPDWAGGRAGAHRRAGGGDPVRAAWRSRRRPASSPRCAPSASCAATTPWSSWATCPRSRRATG